MMKIYTLSAALLLACSLSASAAYETPGTGKTYTLQSLVGVAPDSVLQANGKTFTVAYDITINENDKFVLDDNVTVLFKEKAVLTINGHGTLVASERSYIKCAEGELGKGIYMHYDGTEPQTVRNLDFDGAQLRNYGKRGFTIEYCNFRNANGKLNSSGAIAIGTSNACFVVRNCRFENNSVPAIGGGANIANGIIVENCYLNNNVTENRNKPQLNLTVGGPDSVIIRNCEIIGNPEHTKVGGIAVANMLGISGTNNILIEGCTIKENRYGITTMGACHADIYNNTLINNNHETNPINGGSGISLNGSGKNLSANISGNHIEGNLWGITIIKCAGEVNLGQLNNTKSPGFNKFLNNGNNGNKYDVYNNQTANVYAQNNCWGVTEQKAELIKDVIFDKTDDENLGQVIFEPFWDSVEGVNADQQGIVYSNGEIITLSGNETTLTIYDATGAKLTVMSTTGGRASLNEMPKGMLIVASPLGTLKILNK